MGTRSLTHVHDNNGEPLLTIYQQYDGYPSGVGKTIKEILQGSKVVNGFGRDANDKTHNGMGCLAATLVAKRKEGIGNVYIYPAGSHDCGEDFTYTIKALPERPSEGFLRLGLKVESFGNTIYDGPLDEFDPDMEMNDD